MGIGSYKEAERYRMRANKNLTRSFYLDTRRTLDDEPFAWEQPQDAGIMQPEAVQEFNDGGRVGFELGGKVRSRGEKIMSKDKLDLIDNIVSESNLNPFSSLSKNKVLEKAGYSHSAYSFVNSQVKEKLKTLIPIEEKFKSFGWQSFKCNGHNIKKLYQLVKNKKRNKPLAIIAETIKGYPVSFMMHKPIWHYKSPDKNEYKKAITEIDKL